MYQAGVKKSPDSYLRIPMAIIPKCVSLISDFSRWHATLISFSHHLELRNTDGSLMAFVSTGLPSHIRSSLEVNLLAALEHPHLLEAHDTRLPGGPQFQAMHLSWYNRHCTKASYKLLTSLITKRSHAYIPIPIPGSWGSIRCSTLAVGEEWHAHQPWTGDTIHIIRSAAASKDLWDAYKGICWTVWVG
jgi:hypothetical protein